MTQEKLAHIQTLQERLEELELEKKDLEGKLQALVDGDGEASAAEATSTVSAIPENEAEIVNGLYLGDWPESADEQIEIYRRVVAARSGKLPLRRMLPPAARIGHAPAFGLSLPALYVGLDTDLNAPAGVVNSALKAARRGEFWPFPLPRKRGSEHEADAGEPRRVTAMEAAILRRTQILLGGPGSGKTTFLNLLAYALATGDAQHLGDWPAAEREYLPILVVLGDFAAWIGAHGGSHEASASIMWGYILHDLRERNLGFAIDPLYAALERGEVLLLLDGLDEVPASLLPSVRDSIQDSANRYASCRILVTCRVLAYEQPDLQLSARRFPKTTLVPFDVQRIDDFIGAWYAQVSAQRQALAPRGLETAEALKQMVRRPDLRGFAPQPILLTVMALVHTHRGELPDSRARLYEEAINILLFGWEQGSQGAEPRLTDLLNEARRDRTDLIRMFERLSYEVCAGTVYAERRLIAGMGEQDLIRFLRQLHPAKHLDWAQSVLDTLILRSGLVVESQPGTFCFLHRTFQEYLAGAHLAHSVDFPEEAVALLADWAAWRETILQAVGFLVHNQRELGRVLLLVEKLCPPQPPSDDFGWRRVWLAGEVLLGIGLSRIRDDAAPARLLEHVSRRLAVLVERGALQARERAQVGDVLGMLGDARFDHSRFRMSAHFRGERENALGLVLIKSGPLVMGSSEEDSEAEPDELGNPPKMSVDYRYWVARYPITVAQFAAFVRTGGYDCADWWTEFGLDWCRRKKRREPDSWSEQSAFDNRPVVGVSWFEAMAYARWLDVHLRRRSGHVPADYLMRLPTEAEWEMAARGGAGRIYAWGDEWEDSRANTSDSIGRPVSVGMFPDGGAPHGVQDLSGNVWEWCLTGYRPYPYKSDDGRNNPESSGARVLRGGSWLQDYRSARCACRLVSYPDQPHRDAGFRLVLSIADTKSA